MAETLSVRPGDIIQTDVCTEANTEAASWWGKVLEVGIVTAFGSPVGEVVLGRELDAEHPRNVIERIHVEPEAIGQDSAEITRHIIYPGSGEIRRGIIHPDYIPASVKWSQET